MANLTPADIAAMKKSGLTNQDIADAEGVSEATIRRWARAKPTLPGGEPDTVTISDAADEDEVRRLVREQGLDPEHYEIASLKVSEWGGETKQRSISATLRLKLALALPVAVDVAPIEGRPVHVSVHEPARIILEADQHAPYIDGALDDLLTRFHHDLKPTGQAFLGDGVDLPTVSRHRDHPSAMATPNDCIQGYYELLRRRREAAPGAFARLLDGNHDVRIETELLSRAERLHALACADTGDGEREPIWSWDKALHLGALGIERVTHPLGWQHAELTLAPDLVARHGWLHGANTADKTVRKRGASIIVGHTHQRETSYHFDPFTGREYVCHVLGMVGSTALHYAPENNWTQGAGVATVWPDGRWTFDHVVYADGSLIWRDQRWDV